VYPHLRKTSRFLDPFAVANTKMRQKNKTHYHRGNYDKKTNKSAEIPTSMIGIERCAACPGAPRWSDRVLNPEP
jgi:hypothetical protein